MTIHPKFSWLMLSSLALFGVTVTPAQSLREVFKRVNPAVVVAHTRAEANVQPASSTKAFNLPQRAGLMVQSVATNSLGHRRGLRGAKIPSVIDGQPLLIGGDVLLEIGGVPVLPAYASVREQQRMQSFHGGDTLKMNVWRSEQVLELTTTIP